MPSNWKSKLYVKITVDGVQSVLTPIVDINPTFNTPHVPEHSLEADNVGVTKGNDTFAFSLTVKALRDDATGTNPAKVLTDAQLNHKPFSIIMLERQIAGSSGDNWAFTESVQLENCYVNNGSPSRAVINTSPVAVFNCISLGVTIDSQSHTGM